MDKLVIGRKRNGERAAVSKHTDVSSYKNGAFSDTVFVLGAALACVMLAFPMLTDKREVPSHTEAEVAVATMSGSVPGFEREEVMAPSNAAVEEWSFYDYIGELFAGLLSGKG